MLPGTGRTPDPEGKWEGEKHTYSNRVREREQEPDPGFALMDSQPRGIRGDGAQEPR